MKILTICKRQYTGKDLLDDAYGRMYEIPSGLAACGHEVQGFVLSYRKRGFQEVALGGVRWSSWDAGRVKTVGLVRFARHIHREIRRWQPDVVLCGSDSLFVIAAQAAARGTNVPVVADLYDNFEAFAPARIPGVMRMYRAALKQCAGVLCVSDPLRRKVETDYGIDAPVKTVINGVDTAVFQPRDQLAARTALGLPASGPLVGTAGGLLRNRNIGVLYRAFAELHRRHPDVRLVVAGPRDTAVPDGPAAIDLGEMPYERMPVLFNALDVGVICNTPSAFGSYCFPQKAQEMIACGLPICVANVGAMAKVFAASPQSLFKADDPHALADALEQQLSDPERPAIRPSSWIDLARQIDVFLSDIRGSWCTDRAGPGWRDSATAAGFRRRDTRGSRQNWS